MDQRLEFTVESAGTRLDVCIAAKCGISRAHAQKLAGEGLWQCLCGKSPKNRVA